MPGSYPVPDLADRPTHRVNKVDRYVGNRVVQHLMNAARIRGACSLPELWTAYNNGTFTASEMKEFYQLLGCTRQAYESVFNAAFEEELQNPKPKEEPEDLDTELVAPRPKKKIPPKQAPIPDRLPSGTPLKKQKIRPVAPEPESSISDDPDRVAAAHSRKRAVQTANDDE